MPDELTQVPDYFGVEVRLFQMGVALAASEMATMGEPSPAPGVPAEPDRESE